MADIGRFIAGAFMLAGGAILAFTGGHALASIWISVGLGLFTQGLFGLPEFQSGIEQNVTGTQVALPVVYGEAIVGHAVAEVRMTGSENEYMHLVGALCVASENGEGIESIDEIYFGNDLAIDILSFGIPAPSILGSEVGVEGFWFRDNDSLVRYNLHLGTDSQVVDPFLNNVFPAEWPASSVGLNIAYVHFRLQWDDSEERRFSGIPQITYKVKGNRLYDPRFPTNGPDGDGYCWDAADSDTSLQASTNGYADLHPGKNPALGLYDYLTSVKYGVSVPTSRIDTQSFIDHANYCDDEVTLTGVTGTPSQPRYQINGVISTGDDHKVNIEKFLSAMNANLVWGQGKIFLMPRKPQTAETFELTDDNILGQISVTRSGMATPNTMRARFPDEDNDYNIMDVVWPEPGTNDYLTADNNWESEHLIDLPLTTNYYMAQHLAMIALRELREDVTIELTATEESLVLQPGHIVKVTYDTAGWTQKEFRVITMNLTDESTVRFQLREYDAGVYSLDPQNDKPTVPGSDLPNPLVVLPPTGVSVTCGVPFYQPDNTYVYGVTITWTHSIDPFGEWEEPLYREVGTEDWVHSGRRVLLTETASANLFGFLEQGKEYEFTVVTYNHLGRVSSYPTGGTCTIGSVGTITNLTGTYNCDGIIIQFTLPPDTVGGPISIVYTIEVRLQGAGETVDERFDAGTHVAFVNAPAGSTTGAFIDINLLDSAVEVVGVRIAGAEDGAQEILLTNPGWPCGDILERGPLVLNPTFSEGTGEGSYWAIDTSSGGTADADTNTVGLELDLIGSTANDFVILPQVEDADGDITKSVTVY